jgi:hypothetical protein
MKELLQSQAGRWSSLATLRTLISRGNMELTTLKRRRWTDFGSGRSQYEETQFSVMGREFFFVIL